MIKAMGHPLYAMIVMGSTVLINIGLDLLFIPVMAAKNVTPPKQLDGVFSESLAKCGRIFSSAHSYFSVKEIDKSMLAGFVTRLKEKYHVS